MRHQPDVLDHVADRTAQGDRVPVAGRHASDPDIPRGRFDQPVDELQERRLPRPARSQDGEALVGAPPRGRHRGAASEPSGYDLRTWCQATAGFVWEIVITCGPIGWTRRTVRPYHGGFDYATLLEPLSNALLPQFDVSSSPPCSAFHLATFKVDADSTQRPLLCGGWIKPVGGSG